MIDIALKQLAGVTETSIFDWQKIKGGAGYRYIGKRKPPDCAEPLSLRQPEPAGRKPLLKIPKQGGLPGRWV